MLLVCVLPLPSAHGGRGCNGHPAFPTPSLGERFINGSGASRREVASVCLDVIASAAKQSISPRKERMDCFAALAMTAGTMDCFAEPVIGRAFARPVGCVPSMIGSLEVKVFYPA